MARRRTDQFARGQSARQMPTTHGVPGVEARLRDRSQLQCLDRTTLSGCPHHVVQVVLRVVLHSAEVVLQNEKASQGASP